MEVSSFGNTRDKAREAVKEALELYFEDAPDAEVMQVADVGLETVKVEAV